MTVAVLPLNAGPNARPALARQIPNFACDIVRNRLGGEVNSVNFLIQVTDQPRPRFANVNASETLNEWQMLEQLFGQNDPKIDRAMDGLLVEEDGKLKLDVRFFDSGNEDPIATKQYEFTAENCFATLRQVVTDLASQAGKELADDMGDDEGLFGTSNPAAFLKFLESYDAIQYIEKTQGAVVEEFNPHAAMESLAEAAKMDPEWEAPYVGLIQLGRLCAQFQVGDPLEIEKYLKQIIETAPDDFRGHFAIGELYQAMGNLTWAADSFEKAVSLSPEEPAILTRLGIVQMQMGMPVNAERNFKKAIEMEPDEKPSMDFLAQVLEQQSRGHEIPALWREMVEKDPQNAQARVKLGVALHNTEQHDEAKKVFEEAIEVLEDPILAKRWYAPLLMQAEELDRAMDYYEDCLDVAPNDIQLLMEYAQTLQKAGRDFEVPKVLQQALDSNPDQNARAQIMAWKLELEQPKRVESVMNAEQLVQQGDFEGAIRMLKPMRNWLSDYWKMWAVMAAAENRAGKHEDAEQTATTLINLFPGCEPAYAEVATALSAQGKHEEAYNALRFAASQINNSLTIAVNLALAANRAGKKDEARALAKQIREMVGHDNKELNEVFAEIDAV